MLIPNLVKGEQLVKALSLLISSSLDNNSNSIGKGACNYYYTVAVRNGRDELSDYYD